MGSTSGWAAARAITLSLPARILARSPCRARCGPPNHMAPMPDSCRPAAWTLSRYSRREVSPSRRWTCTSNTGVAARAMGGARQSNRNSVRSMRRLTTRGWAHGAMGVRAKALTAVGPRPRGCDIGVHGSDSRRPGSPCPSWGRIGVGMDALGGAVRGVPGAGLGMPGAGFEPFRLSRGPFWVSRGPF